MIVVPPGVTALTGPSTASRTQQSTVVLRMVTGYLDTNCYLLYEPASGEAALIDVGGEIEPLVAVIDSEHLNVRYFLFTHGHHDHIMGLSALRDRFPGASVCMHRADADDLAATVEWVRSQMEPETLAAILADPEARKLTGLDAAAFGTPDVYLSEGLELTLGCHTITVLHSPGHSPGSVCFSIAGLLFSGDVLFRDAVGRVDFLHGSREDQIRSVRRLYASLPDDTPVYPGHGEATTIGREKRKNQCITVEAVNL